MNAKSKINQKLRLIPPPAGAAGWGQLQHVKTLMGLSRKRFDREEILALIDTREVQWAWDIGRKGAQRPEVRIWRESLLAYLAGEAAAVPAVENEPLSLSQVIEKILPRPPSLALRAATLRAPELQRRFLCCRTHITGLITDGELCRVGTARPGATPVILYQSAFEFLKRRSMSI